MEIINDKDFAITITYDEDGESKTVTLKPGDTITVPEDQIEIVKKQIVEAKATADGEAKEDVEPVKVSELREEVDAAAAVIAGERQKLEDERQALAEERAMADYDKYVAEGKLAPAQKTAFLAIAGQVEPVGLADGTEKSNAMLMREFLESAPKGVSLQEEVGNDGEGDEDIELTAEEKEMAATFGNSEEQLKEIKKGEK